jgi:hypothetical protein
MASLIVWVTKAMLWTSLANSLKSAKLTIEHERRTLDKMDEKEAMQIISHTWSGGGSGWSYQKINV